MNYKLSVQGDQKIWLLNLVIEVLRSGHSEPDATCRRNTAWFPFMLPFTICCAVSGMNTACDYGLSMGSSAAS